MKSPSILPHPTEALLTVWCVCFDRIHWLACQTIPMCIREHSNANFYTSTTPGFKFTTTTWAIKPTEKLVACSSLPWLPMSKGCRKASYQKFVSWVWEWSRRREFIWNVPTKRELPPPPHARPESCGLTGHVSHSVGLSCPCHSEVSLRQKLVRGYICFFILCIRVKIHNFLSLASGFFENTFNDLFKMIKAIILIFYSCFKRDWEKVHFQ